MNSNGGSGNTKLRIKIMNYAKENNDELVDVFSYI